MQPSASRARGLVSRIVAMDLSVNSPCMVLVLRVYCCSARIDCGAVAAIRALVLDRAVVQAFDVGKVQLGGRQASAVRFREGDDNREIRLNGASGVVRDEVTFECASPESLRGMWWPQRLADHDNT